MAQKENSQHRSPYIIELVGPAGSGKTTFTNVLSKGIKNLQVIEQPNYRQLKCLPFFLINAIRIFPVILDVVLHGDREWLTRRAIALMIILSGWHRMLRRQKRTESREAFFIDQGPVSFFAYLIYQGPCFPKSPRVLAWWDKMYGTWAKTLGTVIYMDAPNKILHERIRSRDQEHGLKTESFEKAVVVLDTYREIYEEVFAKLQAESPGLKVLRYESTALPKEQFHSEVIQQIGQELSASD